MSDGFLPIFGRAFGGDAGYRKERSKQMLAGRMLVEMLRQKYEQDKTGGPVQPSSDLMDYLAQYDKEVANPKKPRFFGLGAAVSGAQGPIDVRGVDNKLEAQARILELGNLSPIQKKLLLDEIENIQRTQDISPVVPRISEVTGIPLNPENFSADTENSIRTLGGMEQLYGTDVIGGPRGSKYTYNKRTGTLQKIIEAGPAGSGINSLMIPDGQGGFIAVSGENISPSQAGDVVDRATLARENAKRNSNFEQSVTNTATTVTLLHDLTMDLSQQGLTGWSARAADTLSGILEQSKQILGDAPSNQLYRQAENAFNEIPNTNALKQAAVKNAQIRATLIHIVYAMAYADNPAAKSHSDNKIRDYMSSIMGNPNDPAATQAAVQRHIDNMIEKLRISGRGLKRNADAELGQVLDPKVFQETVQKRRSDLLDFGTEQVPGVTSGLLSPESVPNGPVPLRTPPKRIRLRKNKEGKYEEVPVEGQ